MLLLNKHKDMLEHAIFRLSRMQEGLEFHYGFSSNDDVKTLEDFKQKVIWYNKCLDKIFVFYINSDIYKVICKLASQQCLDVKQTVLEIKDVS